MVCTAVVIGLSNFQVGFPTTLPTAGVIVLTNAYTVCGSWKGSVSAGLEIRVDCSTPVTETFQYVIVQSLDTLAKKLCIADICVYAAGLYVINYVRSSYWCPNNAACSALLAPVSLAITYL